MTNFYNLLILYIVAYLSYLVKGRPPGLSPLPRRQWPTCPTFLYKVKIYVNRTSVYSIGLYSRVLKTRFR